jgi:hypothetical protein
MTLNLESVYKNKLFMDFDFSCHNDNYDAKDGVYIRGSENDKWLLLVDLFSKRNGFDKFASVTGIALTDTLNKYNQVYSKSTQIRFRQNGDNLAEIGGTNSDGYSFDNINIYGIIKNIQLVHLDSPTTGCGLDTNEKVIVRIRNSGSTIQYNTPIAISDNTGNAIYDTCYTPLQSGDETLFKFKKTLYLSNPGIYSFKVYLTDNDDINKFDDTLKKIVISKAKPTPRYTLSNKTALCMGDSVTITLNKNFKKIRWSDGDSSQIRTIKSSLSGGILKVEEVNGCTNTTSIPAITVHPLPKPILKQSKDSVLSNYASGTFKWIFNKAFLAETTPYVLPKSNGQVRLFYTDTNQCSAFSDTLNYIFTSVVKLNEDKSSFGIYPNPLMANELLNIAVEEKGQLKLYDISGKLLFDKALEGINKYQLQINVAQGVYQITFENAQGDIERTKLIVK